MDDVCCAGRPGARREEAGGKQRAQVDSGLVPGQNRLTDLALCPQIMIRSIFLFLDRTYVLQNSTLPSIW